MSAGDSAHVQLVDHVGLKHMIMNVAKDPKQFGDFRAIMIINGQMSPGWEFAAIDLSGNHDKGEKYGLILRHPLDERIGTAEYTCVYVDGHGDGVEVVQYVLIQNDNDYTNETLDRFWMLTRHAPHR